MDMDNLRETFDYYEKQIRDMPEKVTSQLHEDVGKIYYSWWDKHDRLWAKCSKAPYDRPCKISFRKEGDWSIMTETVCDESEQTCRR